MEIKKFNNGFMDLGVKLGKDGAIEFDAEQAAIGLGIVDTSKGYQNVRWNRVNNYLNISATSGGKVLKGDFITEPQFYKLAIKANNQVAERFQDWVTDEVLPSIRKNGVYLTEGKAQQIVSDPQTGLADLLIQAGNQLKEKQAKIEEQEVEIEARNSQIVKLKPKAEYHDKVLKAKAEYTTTQIAKMYGMSARKLNSTLHELKFIYPQSGSWVLYSKFHNEDLMETETKLNQYGYAYSFTRWTEKGRRAIFFLLKNKLNLKPLKAA